MEASVRWGRRIAGALLLLGMLGPASAQTPPLTKAQRWVSADDVRLRAGPGKQHQVLSMLQRGAGLLLLKADEADGYCFVEGEGQQGYVACQYLSAERIARPRAGENGVDAAQRWVGGNGVTLREQPSPGANVLGRMSLNTVVKLVRDQAGRGYCEVQLATGQRGYTACRYLAVTPVVLAHVRGDRQADEALSPDYDPERAFWLEPSWQALEAYAQDLKRRRPEIPPQGPWPRDVALERMKAHLDLGLKGSPPAPYADWAELKRKAAQDLDLSGQARRLQEQGKAVPQELWMREYRLQSVASELQSAIGIWGPLYDAISSDGGAARIVRLVRALEFPTVRRSLFGSVADIAPGHSSAQEASGRFGIVFRQWVTPRPVGKAGDESSGPGVYDMLARTQALVRPVQRVQLFRDGQLRSRPSVIRSTETLWRDVDEPECSGWTPGFTLGAADPAIWRYFGDQAQAMAKLNANPAGSLYVFYLKADLPRPTAIPVQTQVVLDREATGFVRGTTLHHDLDGDGVPDLAVWEGQGKGTGHLDGVTITDDRWYRLVLVNIDGAWKVLGSDVFGYGCGC